MSGVKRVFGRLEAGFDLLYLAAALAISLTLLLGSPSRPQALAGLMGLALVSGDALHLLPRVRAALTGGELELAQALGLGKLAASITMTVFYLLLWRTGLLLFDPALPPLATFCVYGLGLIRILLCLLPQNRWTERHPPLNWAVYRNIPFVLLGAGAAWLYGANQGRVPALTPLASAIALSFIFYLPVVLWGERRPRLGMLMLPKSCAYIWMLAMFLPL